MSFFAYAPRPESKSFVLRPTLLGQFEGLGFIGEIAIRRRSKRSKSPTVGVRSTKAAQLSLFDSGTLSSIY